MRQNTLLTLIACLLGLSLVACEEAAPETPAKSSKPSKATNGDADDDDADDDDADDDDEAQSDDDSALGDDESKSPQKPASTKPATTKPATTKPTTDDTDDVDPDDGVPPSTMPEAKPTETPMVIDTKPAQPYDYEGQKVALDKDLVIPAGKTVKVGAGTTFTASMGVTVRVEGTLVVEGKQDSLVRFDGKSQPKSWEGIVVESGGKLMLVHTAVSGANFAIHAKPGSMFSVDHAELGSSFKCAVVQSNGSFDHTKFHASGDPTFSISSAAPITDVNGTLTIVDASPTVKNSHFDNSAPLVDMIRVRGNSSPILDHLHLEAAHCGVHMEGTNNSSPVVTNSVFQGLTFGVMAYTMKPKLQNNVFVDNGDDVGYCLGATADNAPILEGNFFASGSASIDASCARIGTKTSGDKSARDPSAGPVDL